MMGEGFMRGGGWHGGGFNGDFGLIGPLFMLVFLGLMVTLIVLGVLWLTKAQKTAPTETDDAKREALLDALKKTYASGRIDTKEYEARKKILEI